MLSRIKKSLAYRLPAFYRHILKYKDTAIKRKDKSNLVILMMTGKNHLDLTRLSVLSIANTWKYSPNLIINNDGTITNEKIEKSLSFWKGSINIHSWKESTEYHSQKERYAISNYADKDPFGKKLAIILHYAEKQPVLWIDSDILFFNDFTDFIPKKTSGIVCGGSEDFTGAYHEILLKKFNNNLYKLRDFNAGLLYVSGEGIYEAFKLENILDELHPAYDFLTEQTIFAHIASKSLGVLWGRNIIKNFNYDNQEIKPMSVKNIVARHYTSNVRHLFWRDALFKT